jgi:hypothetical protein
MFKIEKTVFVNKTFRFEKQFAEKLEQIAQQNNVSVNALVIQCCKYALDNMIENISDKNTPTEQEN